MTSRPAVSNATFVPPISVPESQGPMVVPTRATTLGAAVTTWLAIAVVIDLVTEDANVIVLVPIARADGP